MTIVFRRSKTMPPAGRPADGPRLMTMNIAQRTLHVCGDLPKCPARPTSDQREDQFPAPPACSFQFCLEGSRVEEMSMDFTSPPCFTRSHPLSRTSNLREVFFPFLSFVSAGSQAGGPTHTLEIVCSWCSEVVSRGVEGSYRFVLGGAQIEESIMVPISPQFKVSSDPC